MATLLTQETFPNNELKQTYEYTNTLLIIRDYLALKRASSFIGQIEFHLSKNALCQVWLKLGHWVWRKFFSNAVNEFSRI